MTLPNKHLKPIRERRFKYTPLSRITMSKYFRLREFCQHDLALIHGIKNVPNEIGVARGRLLAQRLLDPAYEHFGELRILQGYVSPALNRIRQGAGAVASPTSLHMWDQKPEAGLNYGIACDFCIKGREGDVQAQRELVEFYGQSDLPWHNILVFPRTSSIHLVHNNKRAEHYINLRVEFFNDEGRPKSEYFRINNYQNVPWELLQLGTQEALTNIKGWLAERGEYRKWKK